MLHDICAGHRAFKRFQDWSKNLKAASAVPKLSQKNKVRSLRVSPQLDARITSYALSTNQKEADAIRDLIEKGLARVCSRGTKASLHTAMMPTDVSRAIVPTW